MSDTPGGGGYDIPLPGMPGGGGPPRTPRGPQLPSRASSGADLPQTLPEAQGTSWRERAFSFVTGRDARGAAAGDRRSQLIAAFGSSPRDPGRPDVRAAAEGLGVSTRSVQRWLAGGGIRPQHAQDLQKKARQAMTTKRGRARAVRAGGILAPPKGKNALRVAGDQGVVSSSDGNYRMRETTVRLEPEDRELLQQLWVEHGEAGVDAFMHQHWDAHYQGGWHFRSIDDISWDNSPHY